MKTRTKTMLLGLGLATCVLVPTLLKAQVPASMPIQGSLSDANGVPITGDRTIQLRLYDVPMAGTALHDETQTVTIDDGAFTVYLGDMVALDMSIFDGQDLWVGITVDNDAEMTPRLSLGTVPYAAYAGDSPGTPTGAVMFFDLGACPTGWTEFAALQGRVPVGVPSAGTLSGTVGTALGDLGERSITTPPLHSHVVNPPNTGSSSTGSHGHTVNPPATGSTNQSTPHTHSGTTNSDGMHRHQLDVATATQPQRPNTKPRGDAGFLSGRRHLRSAHHACGRSDAAGVALCAPLGEVSNANPSECAMWAKVSAHVSAGHRLRRAMDELEHPTLTDQAEAILEPDGRLQHAQGDAKESSIRDKLRDAGE